MIKKGSFAGHPLDELVEQFEHRQAPAKPAKASAKDKRVTAAKLNQVLFERATR
jgi:hypothetical protein